MARVRGRVSSTSLEREEGCSHVPSLRADHRLAVSRGSERSVGRREGRMPRAVGVDVVPPSHRWPYWVYKYYSVAL